MTLQEEKIVQDDRIQGTPEIGCRGTRHSKVESLPCMVQRRCDKCDSLLSRVGQMRILAEMSHRTRAGTDDRASSGHTPLGRARLYEHTG
jgi:hypothetical protein